MSLILNLPNRAVVRPWLTVGDLTSCGTMADIGIHIYRSDFAPRCDGLNRYKESLSFDYKDGEAFTPAMFSELDRCADRIRNAQLTVLVHCHAGVTRSASVAAYLLSRVEGLDIFDAISEVSKAIWRDRKLAANAGCYEFVTSVLKRNA